MYKNLVFDFDNYCFDVECLEKKVTKDNTIKEDKVDLNVIEHKNQTYMVFN